MMSRSSSGLRPGSIDAVSTTWTSAAQRSMWRRKSWPEAATVRGSLDEAGYVGDDEGRVAGRDHAEVGDQRGERVVGDLGPGPRDRRDERGLAGAREADQADVGDDLQLEPYLELVARLAQQREAGRLALGGGERGVAEPTATSGGDHQRRAVAHQVGQHVAVRVLDQRAVGDGEDEVLAVATVLVVAGALAAVLGATLRAVVVVDEGRHAGVDLEDDRAALPTVAPVGAAERLELLTVHRGHTVATSSGCEVQRDVVDERGDGHGVCSLSVVEVRAERASKPQKAPPM